LPKDLPAIGAKQRPFNGGKGYHCILATLIGFHRLLSGFRANLRQYTPCLSIGHIGNFWSDIDYKSNKQAIK